MDLQYRLKYKEAHKQNQECQRQYCIEDEVLKNNLESDKKDTDKCFEEKLNAMNCRRT